VDINDLRQERAKLITDMRVINDKAIAEGKDLAGDPLAEYERMEVRFDEIGNQIKRIEKLTERDRIAAAGAVPINGQDGWGEDDQKIKDAVNSSMSADARAAMKLGVVFNSRRNSKVMQASGEKYSGAFWAMQRLGRNAAPFEVHNALQVGTDAEGGYLVPTEYETILVQKKILYNEIRNVATVTTSSADTNIPVESDQGTATWTAEEAAYTESDSVFAQVVLNAYKLGRIMKVSEELMQDAFFDMPAYIANAYGRSFGIAEEAAFIAGGGSTLPTGIIPGAATGITAASATAITADEIIDLYHAVARPYRAMGTWLMPDATVKLVRQLKDTTNQYLWQPGLQSGEPDLILGRPLITSDSVPAATTGLRAVGFGDMSYYRIIDRLGTVMQRLNELYAANGQIGFRMYSRTDGKLTLAEAVKVITML